MVSFEMPYKICENIDILFFLIPENIPETKFSLIRNISFLFCQAQLQLSAQLKAELALFPLDPATQYIGSATNQPNT